MELKAFVKAALNDVMDAVQETIEERKVAGKHGYINPKTHDPDEMEIDTISFDVAISAGTKTQGGGEAGLEVFSVKIGANGSREHESSNVSRIQFTLGVSWPHTHVLDAKKLIRAN
ncbi:hypothetical protein [Rhizobium sp. TRM95796]|uniref:hypothetical protein n=1 Tax=Rhizobium sp. TRM95796 TaxID=2979862 RepID=UPI0021E83C77|nr:hypothetical protein [Rhizobium sp. TRM95796]MCV3766464.1 hypothetical protein [Rhizobium sp. TRM95796]